MKNLLTCTVIILIGAQSVFAQSDKSLELETNAKLMRTIVHIKTIDQLALQQSKEYNWGALKDEYHAFLNVEGGLGEFPPGAASFFLSYQGGDSATSLMLDATIIGAAYFLDVVVLTKLGFYNWSAGLDERSWLGSNVGWFIAPSLSSGVAWLAYDKVPSINTSIIMGSETKIVDQAKDEHQLNAREYADKMAIIFELNSAEEKKIEKAVYKILMKNSYRAMNSEKNKEGKLPEGFKEVNIFEILDDLSITNAQTKSILEFKAFYNNYQENLRIHDHESRNSLMLKQFQDANLLTTLERIDSTLKMIEIRQGVITDPKLNQQLDAIKLQLLEVKEDYELEKMVQK